MPQVSLMVNGTPHTVAVEDCTLLVGLLRQKLGLTSTHVGCDTSQCGSCIVHVAGQSVKARRRTGRARSPLRALPRRTARRTTPAGSLNGDMHASIPCCAHLIGVMAQRAVARS